MNEISNGMFCSSQGLLSASPFLLQSFVKAKKLLSLGLISSILIIKSKRTQEASSFIQRVSELAQNIPPLHCHLGNKDNPEQPESPLEKPSSQKGNPKVFPLPTSDGNLLEKAKKKKEMIIQLGHESIENP